MQHELLPFLKCPLTKTDLCFQMISDFHKDYNGIVAKEIKEGLLFSQTGFVFPIIDGIPRLLIESVYDYADFLKQHIEEYDALVATLENSYGGVLRYCIQKNKKTKQSFELEWSFLKRDKNDHVWHDAQKNFSEIFLSETGINELSFFNDKKVIDIGCGHGLMTSEIAAMAKTSVGVEISKAVEHAYRANKRINAWYIQADLQFLPFADAVFDVLYSSGVIHHTNNTELSLSLIEPVLKPGGNICLWLYHPQLGKGHRLILWGWRFFKKLPLKLSFYLLMIFVFPVTFLWKKIKNKRKINYREEIIDLLDQFTPEFRFEIPHDRAMLWLIRRKFNSVLITSTNQFGFSVVGEKQV